MGGCNLQNVTQLKIQETKNKGLGSYKLSFNFSYLLQFNGHN